MIFKLTDARWNIEIIEVEYPNRLRINIVTTRDNIEIEYTFWLQGFVYTNFGQFK